MEGEDRGEPVILPFMSWRQWGLRRLGIQDLIREMIGLERQDFEVVQQPGGGRQH